MRCVCSVAACMLVVAQLSVIAQTNQPPTVFAGNDTTIRLIWPKFNEYRFTPTITDDGQIYAVPKVLWAQIAGPQGGMEILAPDAERSKVDPYKIGQYTFVITVDDSQYIVRDTIKVTVLDSIPFQVLAPVEGEKVVIGSRYTVRWRIDPPGTDIVADFSVDDGANYSTLILNRTRDSMYVWNVPDSLLPSNSCVIRVRDYRVHTRQAYSGVFSLVEADSEPKNDAGCGCGSSAGLAFIPPLFFKAAATVRRRRNGIRHP